MVHSLVVAFALVIAVPTLTSAQIPSPPATPQVPMLTTTVDGAGNILVVNTLISPDDASTAEELPGLGHKFELFGVMVRDTDPENAAGNSGGSGGGVGGNETISATTTPTTLAFAYRNLPPGIIPNVYMPWKSFAAAILAALPNHKIRAGFLLDGESCAFSPAAECGKAYYDLFTLENRTLEIW